jgi:hemoglobin-like flavoprotein
VKQTLQSPSLTSEQITEIVRTWALVAHDLSDVGVTFFLRVFELAPEALALFSFSADELRTCPKLRAHATSVMLAVGKAVAGLSDMEALAPRLAELGVRHRGKGVVPAHFIVVGQALLDTLATGLGEHWTETAACAWKQAYASIANAMLGDQEASQLCVEAGGGLVLEPKQASETKSGLESPDVKIVVSG